MASEYSVLFRCELKLRPPRDDPMAALSQISLMPQEDDTASLLSMMPLYPNPSHFADILKAIQRPDVAGNIFLRALGEYRIRAEASGDEDVQ
jgi:hypothetical protein